MQSFRSEAYTGDNRCWPCTVTNLAIATVVAGALALVSPILAAAFFVVGIVLIAFVGYLVPGTPYLTRQYFPKRVLAWFGKDQPNQSHLNGEGVDAGADFDVNGAEDVDRLVRGGVVSVEDDESLALEPDFEDRWTARIASLRDDEGDQRETFAGVVGVDSDTVHFEEEADGTFSVTVGDNNVTQWMSRAAFVADIAANDVMSSVDPEWSVLSLLDRHKLSMGLRQFLDVCPLCDAPLIEQREVAETCCWSNEAITTRCEECGSRMYVV